MEDDLGCSCGGYWKPDGRGGSACAICGKVNPYTVMRHEDALAENEHLKALLRKIQKVLETEGFEVLK